MDTSERTKTQLRLTLCPLCATELNAGSLKKHLSNVHTTQSTFNCPACNEKVHAAEYAKHIEVKHRNILIYSQPLRDKLLFRVLKECYLTTSNSPASYLCATCKQIISKKRVFSHQEKVHKRDYLSFSGVLADQPATSNPLRRETSHTNPKKPQAAESIKRSSGVNSKVAGLDKLLVSGKVPLRVSQRLIMNSAYWYGHPCGRPVRAPKHYENILLHKTAGAYIEFGSNAFLIEEAAKKIIDLCIRSINSNGELNTSPESFIAQAKRIVSGSVTGVGGRYTSYNINSNGHMVFGTQSIHVLSFIKTITSCFNIRSIF